MMISSRALAGALVLAAVVMVVALLIGTFAEPIISACSSRSWSISSS